MTCGAGFLGAVALLVMCASVWSLLDDYAALRGDKPAAAVCFLLGFLTLLGVFTS